MTSIYKYHFDRHTIYWTMIYLVIFVLLGVGLYFLYEGGYLSAWFTSFIVALVALASLSIPRRIVVTDDKVEIRCLLDITELRRDEIASVRRVEPRRMKWFLPVFGGCGFFGYYGHFLDLRRFERVRLYASQWKNFVEITDIYEERLYVSCTEADRLVAELTPPGGNRPTEEEEEEAAEDARDSAQDTQDAEDARDSVPDALNAENVRDSARTRAGEAVKRAAEKDSLLATEPEQAGGRSE